MARAQEIFGEIIFCFLSGSHRSVLFLSVTKEQAQNSLISAVITVLNKFCGVVVETGRQNYDFRFRKIRIILS